MIILELDSPIVKGYKAIDLDNYYGHARSRIQGILDGTHEDDGRSPYRAFSATCAALDEQVTESHFPLFWVLRGYIPLAFHQVTHQSVDGHITFLYQQNRLTFGSMGPPKGSYLLDPEILHVAPIAGLTVSPQQKSLELLLGKLGTSANPDLSIISFAEQQRWLGAIKKD